MSSSSSSDYLAALFEFVSSHKLSGVTLFTIPIGIFLINVILNLWISYIISPNKNEAIDERNELATEVSAIYWNDRDGWSKKLIEKKREKIAALDKKIDRLQNWYMVFHFLSLFLSYGGLCTALLIAKNYHITN
ncbi:hypothetical protein MKX03_000161 [Papaver bracteatum]|nr:hypothetical protein MKX03_000161 [Papaver bracteatum]